MSAAAGHQPVVTEVPERSRYELTIDGELGSFAEYVRAGGRVTFTHTVTDPKHRGQGLAAIVVRHALDDARRRGERVVPQCWYVAELIENNPEYADLLG